MGKDKPISGKWGGARPGAGREAHQPTDELRAFVRDSIIVGYNIGQVAEAMKIARPTLMKHYEREIRLAKMGFLNKAVQVLAEQMQAGSLEAAKFTLARKAGWSEKVDLVSSDGSMTPQSTNQELALATLDAIKRKHAKS